MKKNDKEKLLLNKTVKFSENDVERLRKLCKKEDRSEGYILRKALCEYYESQESK